MMTTSTQKLRKRALPLLSVMALASIFASPSSFAKADDTTATNPKCIVNANDPYDIGLVVSSGKQAGTCMDISLHRPIVILQEDDEQVKVANFWHAGHFWYASVPKTGIDKTIFQIAHFPESVPFVKFAHTQLRYVLKDGYTVKLTPQDGTPGLEPTELSEFEMVDQTVTPETSGGDSKALGGIFKNVIRLVGEPDRAKEELGGNDDITRQFVLYLTDEEKSKILITGIHMSNTLAYNDLYKLFTENCTTVLFKIFDESLVYPEKPHVSKFKIHPWNIHDPVEGTSIHALLKRNLLGEEIQTWNEETGLR